MATPALGLIDTSRFPLACIHAAALLPGDGARILDDLEALLRHGEPFALVIVNDAAAAARSHDEGKARMLWLKENRVRLAAVCRGIVSVMPDAGRMPQVAKMAAGLQGALGLPFEVVATPDAAGARATALLATRPAVGPG